MAGSSESLKFQIHHKTRVWRKVIEIGGVFSLVFLIIVRLQIAWTGESIDLPMPLFLLVLILFFAAIIVSLFSPVLPSSKLFALGGFIDFKEDSIQIEDREISFKQLAHLSFGIYGVKGKAGPGRSISDGTGNWVEIKNAEEILKVKFIIEDIELREALKEYVKRLYKSGYKVSATGFDLVG